MITVYFLFLLNIYVVCNVTAFNSLSKDPIMHMDDLKEDDHGEFELSDIIALSQETVEQTNHPITSDEEKLEACEIHNAYRRNWTYPFVEGSELAYLEYNNTLAWTASLWNKNCIFAHGYSEEDNMTLPAQEEGQCIYQGPSYSLTRGIYTMYTEEYVWWHFNNHSCWDPRQKYFCWHAFQIMMGKTEHVGVYRILGCLPRHTYIYITVWHYYKGVIDADMSVMVYRYGPVCSRCQPGYQCATNLCVPQPERVCRVYNLDCECIRNCMNCGTPDWKTCRCHCKLGWDWPDCSYPCQDRIDFLEKGRWCKRNARNICKREVHSGILIRAHQCRAGCKVCPLVKRDAPPDQLCCGGKVCDEFYALDTNTCECQLLCPSDLCMYHSNITTITTTTTPTTTPTTTAVTTTITTTVSAATTTITTTVSSYTTSSIQPTVISTAAGKSITKQESLSSKKPSATSSITTKTSTSKIQPTVISTATGKSITKQESLSSKKPSATLSSTTTTLTSKIQPTVTSTITEKSMTKDEPLSSKKRPTISRIDTTTSKKFPTTASITTISETSTNKKEERPTSAAFVAALHPEMFLIAFIFILTA